MSKFSRNKAAFDKIFKTMPYRAPAFEASTGKLNTDGTVHPNPSVGLDAGYVWIRRKGERAETRAIAGNVRTDIADIPVRVAQDNITGELTVVGIREGEAILRFGGEWAGSLYAQTAGEAFRTTINGRNLKPGRVKVWISSTLKVNAETFWYNNTATVKVLWTPGNANVLNLSSSVPAQAGSPLTDQQRWVVIALNPNATTPALVAFNGTAVPITQTLLPKDIKDIAVTAGYTRLAAVQLRTGDTTEADITDGEWEDLRPWVVDVNYSAIVGATITNSTIDSSPIGANTPDSGVFTSLHVDAPNIATRFGDGASDVAAAIDGGVEEFRDLIFQTGGVDRWIWRVTSNAEPGDNTGSNITLLSRNDDGTQANTVLNIRRPDGDTLHTVLDTATNSISNTWAHVHNSSGTTVAGFGMAIRFLLRAGTTNTTNAARQTVRWIDPTIGSQAAQMDLAAYYNTTPHVGMSVRGGATGPMFAVLGATPALRQSSTTDLKDMLVTFGFITDGGATPLNLDGGKGTLGRLGLDSVAGSTTAGDVWHDSTQKAAQVYMDGIEQTLSSGLLTATASATVANTVTETTIIGTGVGTKTLPANFWIAGKTIRLLLSGTFADTGTPTLQLRLKLGSTTIVDSTALTLPALAGTQEWRCECRLTCRTTGGSGTIAGTIWFEYSGVAAVGSVDGFNIAPATTTFDTTAIGALDLTVEWGAADAANTITSTFGSVEVLN